ncbi:hypothetical protein M885DRAFT_561351 [Pelagophyceae sp. CCMP2097]|nr:hypothetical protein M885DRAFT_561351 [Pelagophyceae sp. CCMP2097]
MFSNPGPYGAPPPPPSALHVGITCDGCGAGVSGTRYKCSACPNFDLCAACYDRTRGKHAPQSQPTHLFGIPEASLRHLFLRVDDPAVSAVGRADCVNRSLLSHACACHGCGARPIVGFRYSCQQCLDVHLCEGCEATGLRHDPSHARLKVGPSPPPPPAAAPESLPQAFLAAAAAPNPFYRPPSSSLFGRAPVTSGRSDFGPAVPASEMLFTMGHVTSGRSDFGPAVPASKILFTTGHVTSGRSDFGPASTQTFGMAHVTSGRSDFGPAFPAFGGFGLSGVGPAPPPPPAFGGGPFGGGGRL